MSCELLDAINCACRDLPDGYIIAIKVENGAAWVEMDCPDGSILDIEEDGYLLNELNAAVVWAIENAKETFDEI